MSSIEEKRVYADKTEETTIYLASELGVVRVSVSGDSIGSFGIEHRCVARDLARCSGLAVATDEDVLVDGELTGFGPALVVGGSESAIAVGPEGRVARFDGEWTTVGRLEGVRAAEDDLLATDEGVYRVGDDLRHVGLEDVNDVSARGVPLAATDSGLYHLANGWIRDLDGRFDRVSGAATGDLARACALAAVGERLYISDGEWHEHTIPEPFAAAAVEEAIYGASAEGTLYVDAGEGWRSQALGISGVRAIAVV